MTYSVGGKIQASDINGFLNNNTPNLNNIWSTGSGNRGYGQTAVPAVAVGEKIRATTWAALVNNINTMAAHQGSSIATMIPVPAVGNKIKYFAPLVSNLATVDANRLNAAAQGSTSSSTITNSTTWSNILTATFTINFTNAAAVRHFFNAGGQIGINCSHPNTGNINTVISQICAAIGTTWMSSATSGTITLAGQSYNGISQRGSTQPSFATINANYGFYNWTPVLTQVLRQLINPSGYHYYSANSFGQVNVAYNGASTITVTLILDEVPNGAVVTSGTSVSLTLRPPSTTHLTNSWGSVSNGTIAISSSITAS